MIANNSSSEGDATAFELHANCNLSKTQTIGGLKQRNDEKFIKAAELDSIATSPIRDHLEQRQIS